MLYEIQVKYVNPDPTDETRYESFPKVYGRSFALEMAKQIAFAVNVLDVTVINPATGEIIWDKGA